MKIMIVDDERLILLGLKSCIEKIEEVKCKVYTASSAQQALETLELTPVDVLITDIEMPGMSGLDLIERCMRKNYVKRSMVLSGYDKFEYARTALRQGVVDYMLKPVDKEELRQNICRIYREMQPARELDLMRQYRPYFAHVEEEDIPPLLKKCVAFMQENYKDSVSLGMLSEYTGKTENYLCSLFKKQWDVTFLDIVNEMRLKDAVYLLLYEPGLSVQDISGRVGYHSERQLFRLFKKYLDMTPQQVRNHETIPGL